MPLKVYFGESLGRYSFESDHPFGPNRLQSFWKETVRRGLDKKIEVGVPLPCPVGLPAYFHTREYIDKVKRLSLTGEGYLDNGDTPAFRGMFEAVSTVVGCGYLGIKEILAEEGTRVFVPVAGLHHARRDSAAGFCVFNDIGIHMETLRREFGIDRIGYVDIDAHHGDGVFYAFEEDPNLIFADIHEDGRYLYPGTGFSHETGKGAARGTKLNIPLEPGSGDHAFFQVWPKVEDFIRAGRPEFILFQAGADSIAGDPLTHLRFSPKAHGHAAKRLCALADECCRGRILAMGGGGYDLDNLAQAWNAVVEGML